MSRGRHARDGQRRDAIRAWIARHIPSIPISRRVHGAAGGATATTPPAEAPEAPAPPAPVPGAGASPELPRLRHADPEGAAAPAPGAGAARPPWVTWHGPPGTPPPPRPAARRDTIAMPAVNAALTARYLAAHEARRDAPAVTL